MKFSFIGENVPIGLLLLDDEPKQLSMGHWWHRPYKSWKRDRDHMFAGFVTDVVSAKRNIFCSCSCYCVVVFSDSVLRSTMIVWSFRLSSFGKIGWSHVMEME
jgi:hypothetical protein